MYPSKRRRPIAPSTQKLYADTLRRAFGDLALNDAHAIPPDVETWPRSTRHTLRAALWNAGREDLAASVEIPYAVKRKKDIPSEEEAAAYEAAAETLPKGARALALLPIRLGLRAREVLTLTREAVQRAVKTGQLKFVRKGGKEAILPAKRVTPLLEELLATRAKSPPWRAKRPARIGTPAPEKRAWQTAGEIISRGNVDTQYGTLYRLVRRAGRDAGMKLHPHLLRHIFATRLSSNGVPVATIQEALGHATLQTTERYVHPSYADLERHL